RPDARRRDPHPAGRHQSGRGELGRWGRGGRRGRLPRRRREEGRRGPAARHLARGVDPLGDARADHHADPRGGRESEGRAPGRSLRTIHEFRTRLARYHLQRRSAAKAALVADPVVETAILRHAQEHSLNPVEVRRRVEQYIDEIVPQLNVLSYYKVGYNLAKI